ncbi:hypothetical protein MesoLjLb_71080 [Mesorhizobium sp. L-8-3]|nr:hypothetical protein MesoLjLb_71080 [Mesorhizobium sp. L-8-3]
MSNSNDHRSVEFGKSPSSVLDGIALRSDGRSKFAEKSLLGRLDLTTVEFYDRGSTVAGGTGKLPQQACLADPAQAMKEDNAGADRSENFLKPGQFRRPPHKDPRRLAPEPIADMVGLHLSSPRPQGRVRRPWHRGFWSHVPGHRVRRSPCSLD